MLTSATEHFLKTLNDSFFFFMNVCVFFFVTEMFVYLVH